MDNINDFLRYHINSSKVRDIDPANDTLRYICDRFELNLEQRYWLAFLYACTYSPTTTYYVYNEFPDYENVDINRLQRWWVSKKQFLIFQTDRLRIKSSNQFVPAFESYQQLMAGGTQHEFFTNLVVTDDPDATYDNVYKAASRIFTFGRFTLFIYLEMLYVLTGLPLQPTILDLSEAESCRNGLALALGRNDLNTHKQSKKLSRGDLQYLQSEFSKLHDLVKQQSIEHTNIWNVETTLCAYKKFRLGKRYVGYYIDRAGKEIEQMSKAIPQGVDWSPLWDFRKETYQHNLLKELWSK